jgi:nucleotide-binding universal stress UspA family protein
MKRILVAYDGSACADAALADLARAGLPAELGATVLCVTDVWTVADAEAQVPIASPRMTEAIQRAHDAAWAAVRADLCARAERGTAKLRAWFPRWRVTSAAVGDTPEWGIVKAADRQAADLVVVGAHGRSAVQRFFLGSVSRAVAVEAACSVRIGRPHPNSGPLRVLVAVDGSRASGLAVQAAVERTWPVGTLFQVVAGLGLRLQTATGTSHPELQPWMQERDADPVAWVTRAVNHFAGRIQSAGWAAEPVILEGEPKRQLLRHAETWSADCLFLGAHGLDHGVRRSLGSFAVAMATQAHCTVEIVRETRAARARAEAPTEGGRLETTRA